MDNKTIIAYFRAKTEYVDLLERLHKSGKYNLIVNAEIAQALAARNIPFEVLENYLTAFTEESHADVKRRLRKLFGMYSFQKKFMYEGKSFFKEIEQELFDNLDDQFSQSIYLINGINNLFKHQKIDLVMVWTDVMRNPKTLTFAAQSHNVPVLQLLHGGLQGYKIGHSENKVYADKISNLAPISKEFFTFYKEDEKKFVETGRIEFDYISDQTITREYACKVLGLRAEDPIVVFGTSWTYPNSATYGDHITAMEAAGVSFIEAFARLKLNHPNLQLVIKVHPSYQEPFSPPYFNDLAKRAGINDAIVTTEHLQEALKSCDLLVTLISTIYIDALLLDKRVVILNFHDMSDHLFLEKHGINYVRDAGDTFEAINRALFDDKFKEELDEKRKKAVHYFNYLNDGKAAERVIDLIKEMAGG